MEDSRETFSTLIQKLDYDNSPNFVSKETSIYEIPAEQQAIWRETESKLQVDAIYFVANTPVIYFKSFETFNQEDIANFHRNVWNQSQVPLLFVVMPNDIRVYNGYEAPTRGEPGKGLNEPSRLENTLSPIKRRSTGHLWERLEIFTRVAIESGSFWRDYSKYFRKETRVDQTLIANLRYVRQELIKLKDLRPEYAHSLIGRSIFALYLQDRGVLSTEDPNFFQERYKKNYTHYTDLLTSYEDTYDFFGFLQDRFNGDMFPVTDQEKEEVDPEHLATLHRLFTVDELAGGQLLFFWAYNFKYIPIELISSIYEEFLHREKSKLNGAYYTPPMLVDFVLDRVMPWSNLNYELSILDPACGSGIFLVEAYRRLVERWRIKNGPETSFKVLSEILTKSIFGVDIQRQALRIAAFSLYLAILDYLEPKSIWLDVHFPTLIGKNLMEGDFFDEQINFDGLQFDLVVGNPPWESNLTSHAEDFLRKRQLTVGDNQIVQAFLWHAPDFCADQGQIALLCSSKSLLFNKSGPNITFRKNFFRKFNVQTIFDFSTLRRFLFEKAVAPATAIIYTSQRPASSSVIFYGAPKPTHFARSLTAILIESTDLKQLPLRQVLDSIDTMDHRDDQRSNIQMELFTDEDDENDEEDDELTNRAINIWKVALWGTNYDYILLQALNNYPSLEEIIEKRGWYSKGGFNQSGPGEGKKAEWLDNALYLDARDFTRYGIHPRLLKVLPEGNLYYRRGDPKRFKAPLVLFKRGQTQRRPSAAFIDSDCTFTDAITGIAGPNHDRDFLKALTALLNSEIAQYYLFLTSASWGVEREEIKAGELRTLPFPFLNASEEQINDLATSVDILTDLTIKKLDLEKFTSETKFVFGRTITEEKKYLEGLIEKQEEALNYFIYNCFQLSGQEARVIHETVQNAIGFFNSPVNSQAQKRPSIDTQLEYAETYIKSINFYLEPLGKKLIARVHNDEDAPLLAVEFFSRSIEEDVPNVRIADQNDTIHRVLIGLSRLNTEHLGKRIYHRRNFRIYDKTEDALSIIKPAEQRLWTTYIALGDAEETVIEMSRPMESVRY
jgi:methylase of polypeptide subunit release factors